MKRRILVLVAAVCVAMGMEAQFFPGFNPQQAKLKAQEEAEKAYQKGNDFLRAKKYDRAFDLYQKAADAGHAGRSIIWPLSTSKERWCCRTMRRQCIGLRKL